MSILRIIDKQTGIFIRDDFSNDAETEIALDVAAAEGLYRPKWNGKKWVESETAENTKAKKDKAEKDKVPTLEERIERLEKLVAKS